MKIKKYGSILIEERRITIDGWDLDTEEGGAIWDLLLDWARERAAAHSRPLNNVTLSNNIIGPFGQFER